MSLVQSVADLADRTPTTSDNGFALWCIGPFMQCPSCFARLHDPDEFRTAEDGAQGCDDCLRICDECEETVDRDSMTYVYTSAFRRNDAAMCEGCTNEHAACCAGCDEHYTFEALESCGDGLYCGGCQEAQREREEREEANRNRAIGDYHNLNRRASTTVLHSSWTRAHGFRTFGVELEVEAPEVSYDDLDDVAGELLNVANVDGRRMWAEHDGSLSNGFELITQPMGLDLHAELWPRVLALPQVAQLRSHNTTTCGLHVHVSRTGLSVLTIAKAVVFLNDWRNEKLIRAVARRYGGGYCAQKAGLKVGQRAASDPDRYVMLNTLPSQTIEFRLFRGSTRVETVLGCIEFAHAVLNFCRDTEPAGLLAERFIDWLHLPENRTDSRNLRALIARRNYGLIVHHLRPTTPVAAPTTTEE